MSEPARLPELLVRYRVDLLRFVERRAGPLLRFETPDDLVQGIHLRALEHQDRFEYRGREPFLGWLHELARNYLSKRRAHWSALKRRPAGLFRLTRAEGTGGVAEPAGAGTGPATFAERREMLTLAVQALDLLMERDRQLVRWASRGVTTDEIAERLDLSRTSAERARQRAVERFRKAFRLLRRRI